MKSFSTSIAISSSADAIWDILTDAPNWPSWNTTVDKVEGKIALGEKITVYTKASPGRAFPLRVTEFSPPQRMVWTGGMPLGLFTGERTFMLKKQSDEKVEFAMKEVFSGLLAPLITRSIPDLQPSFDEFSACLKKCAETSNTGSA